VRRGEGAAAVGPLGPVFARVWTASVLSNLGDGVLVAALPLLAATLTRDPVAFAAVSVAGTLPWLVLSLPAGVLIDRLDRRRIMIATNAWRALLLAGLGTAVVLDRAGVVALAVIAFGLGIGEVLFDNAAQTLLPSIVGPAQLERANGRLYAGEIVMNQFAGPPLGGLLFGLSAGLPILFDAGALVVAAGLLLAIGGASAARAAVTPPAPSDVADGPSFEAGGPTAAAPAGGFVAELREGIAWLRAHRLVRTLAMLLAVLNGTASMGMATFALYAVGEGSILGLGPLGFSLLLTAGSIGSLVGSAVADRLTLRFGRTRLLRVELGISVVAPLAYATASGPVPVILAAIVGSAGGIVWNVITVSLRQRLIPDRLLGRVNSAYRFLGWGAMPLGALIGGLVARTFGLRAPWYLAAAVTALALVPAARVLRTDLVDPATAGDDA
jgi:MFS family permease